jgi:hypothetical protein
MEIETRLRHWLDLLKHLLLGCPPGDLTYKLDANWQWTECETCGKIHSKWAV